MQQITTIRNNLLHIRAKERGRGVGGVGVGAEELKITRWAEEPKDVWFTQRSLLTKQQERESQTDRQNAGSSCFVK